ncbi:hypothetical protein PIIN_11511 [Serendipita indica DSM 11827]|uniref:Uncharacterized protein n=1 Tax=Serendipita indica (strain DSM 11827) TaxID=1109443 RepID=G4U1U1_SERID|nr:hypothetical protein PIIN_11511 [Serendipita indica DSM 11827]
MVVLTRLYTPFHP